MAEVVNLRAKRKEKARATARAKADANAAKFGRSKAEKDLQSACADKALRDLDGVRRE